MSWREHFIKILEARFSERWAQRVHDFIFDSQTLSDREQRIYQAAYQKAYWEGVLDAMDLSRVATEENSVQEVRADSLLSQVVASFPDPII